MGTRWGRTSSRTRRRGSRGANQGRGHGVGWEHTDVSRVGIAVEDHSIRRAERHCHVTGHMLRVLRISKNIELGINSNSPYNVVAQAFLQSRRAIRPDRAMICGWYKSRPAVVRAAGRKHTVAMAWLAVAMAAPTAGATSARLRTAVWVLPTMGPPKNCHGRRCVCGALVRLRVLSFTREHLQDYLIDFQHYCCFDHDCLYFSWIPRSGRPIGEIRCMESVPSLKSHTHVWVPVIARNPTCQNERQI